MMRPRNAQRAIFAAAAAALTLAAAPVSAAASGPGDPEPWRLERPEQPRALLVRNATLWTSGPEGTLENADLLVREGKVAAVGLDLSVPGNALVIDAEGKHVTPGLIDCHSHSFVVGDVNESNHNITAEVSIEDVVNPETTHIYRQLAGGVTCANVLHGSANAIGGQSATLKLRCGEEPETLKMEGAKPGIKFALGENPKMSNWGGDDTSRYPQTRSGVEQLIRERFLAARDYMAEWERWEKSGKRGIPPRRDYQLETIAQILRGERLIHSHSYRADEILMLIRLAEEFGITVGTFQHVLEGYKVADEMAAHGAGASCFSDWWAYKFEVYDAIPYNGALMWDRGAVVSFNSDSSNLARRLNLEAAKAVKYGGVPEDEALKFVTVNPAIQMAIDDRVGSLEPGKDADFVIWNGHPLSSYSLVEQTWVDGRKYFDREADLAHRSELAAERAALLEKVRSTRAGDKNKKDDKPVEDEHAGPEYLVEDGGHGVCTCDAGCEGGH